MSNNRKISKAINLKTASRNTLKLYSLFKRSKYDFEHMRVFKETFWVKRYSLLFKWEIFMWTMHLLYFVVYKKYDNFWSRCPNQTNGMVFEHTFCAWHLCSKKYRLKLGRLQCIHDRSSAIAVDEDDTPQQTCRTLEDSHSMNIQPIW